MDQAVVLLLVGLTSTGAYLAGIRKLGLSRQRLWAAVVCLLECAGMSMVFFCANLAIGLAAIFAVRNLTHVFVSMYFLNEVFIVLLSVLQGIIFVAWLESGPTGGRSR
jgi:hypothetical protein